MSRLYNKMTKRELIKELIKVTRQPRKLTEKERQLLCGCGSCSHGQTWGYCQYTEERMTPENRRKLKEINNKKK
jgi:hypothetical protein